MSQPTFCISDLHCGDRGPRDNFCVGGREERFYKFLEHVMEQKGELVILGDLFDWWQVNLSVSIVKYEKLLRRLERLQPKYVIGNHDQSLAGFIDRNFMPIIPLIQWQEHPYEETIGGTRFAFLHGHEADSYCNSPNPGIGEITAIISGMLEDRNGSPITEKNSVVEDLFIGALETALNIWNKVTLQDSRANEVINSVESYRQSKAADVAIFGHTHRPGHVAKSLYNCGSWSRNQDTYVRIENTGDVGVYEWSKECQPVLLTT